MLRESSTEKLLMMINLETLVVIPEGTLDEENSLDEIKKLFLKISII